MNKTFSEDFVSPSDFLPGCMTKIFVNGNPLDIMVANKQQKVTPGCTEFYSSDVCASHQCQKGRCSAIDAMNYECKCKSGWSGKYCDHGMTKNCQLNELRLIMGAFFRLFSPNMPKKCEQRVPRGKWLPIGEEIQDVQMHWVLWVTLLQAP